MKTSSEDLSVLNKVLEALNQNNCDYVVKGTTDFSGSAEYAHVADIYATPMEDKFRCVETYQAVLETVTRAVGKPEAIRNFKIDTDKIYFGGATYKERIGEWHEKTEKIVTIDDRLFSEKAINQMKKDNGFKEIFVKGFKGNFEGDTLEKREPVPGMTGTLIRKIGLFMYPNKAVGQTVINSLDQPLQIYKYDMPLSKFEEFKSS